MAGVPVVRILAVVSMGLSALIFFLITLGGLVRNEGAGLSCPDWPLCFGHVVPPMTYQVFLEWFHRLVAGSVSVALLLISGAVFAIRELRSRVGGYCAVAIGLLMAQIVLGGLTVLGLLAPKWVSSHLAVGMAFFGVIVVLALRLNDLAAARTDAVAGSGLARLAVFATAAVYAQILLGGLVSSNYAGLACPDFPTCNGQFFPPLEGLVRFQFLHRVGALVATFAVLALAVLVRISPARGRFSPRARRALVAVPALLVIQICLGVGSVLHQLPLLMSVAHLGMAAALFGMLLVTVYELRRCS